MHGSDLSAMSSNHSMLDHLRTCIEARLSAEEMTRTIFGSGIDTALQGLATQSPELARQLVEFPFAEIYTRPLLDLKTREMLTVSALIVLGYAQAELKDHIKAAMNVGCTREEILEIILQIAVYTGFPAALEALKPLLPSSANRRDRLDSCCCRRPQFTAAEAQP
jgi:4-carboxymuconolactone decarboxylase